MSKGVEVHIKVYDLNDEQNAFLDCVQVMAILEDAFEACGLTFSGTVMDIKEETE